MRTRIISIVSLAMIMFIASVSAQYSNDKVPNSIDVSGYAELEVEPNIIHLTIRISEEDRKLSLEQMELSMAKALKKAGIDVEKQLTIEDMSSNLQELFLRKDKINTSKNYNLKLNSVSELTNSIETLESLGIWNINIDKVSHSDLIGLRDKVRVLAIKNARERAILLTEALGVKLGDVIFISDTEQIYNTNYRLSALRNMRIGGGSGSAPKLKFKKVKVSHNVGSTFSFAQ